MQTLNEELNTLRKHKILPDEVPDYITNNLNSKFKLREYQEEALNRFHYYMEDYSEREKPTQLLYHMATGSGKTLIMAANILHLYKKGYRNFIFFVDKKNIIDKTKENFLNPNSSKYLFDSEINFEEKRVKINKVENFSSSSQNEINIKFTTIQGLHFDLNQPKENSITYEDFQDKKTVLISDEAHHINAMTKSENKRNKTEKENMRTWEGTVNKIFKSNKENILLEYTATAQLKDKSIRKKYEDKLLFQYSLKEFRKDKFSKDVDVHEIDSKPMERAIQAIVVSQYKRKVAEKYKIDLKPVVMMKSNRVTKPKNYKTGNSNKVVSSIFKKRFHKKLKNLKVDDLKKIKARAKENILKEAFDFFEENNISLNNLIKELKHDFSKEKSLLVDSKKKSEKEQILVNSLEDKDNKIRVIFAVDKLNEGWDVLNLFDIVRLYDTRDARGNQPGKTTTAEAQLIGRGARYCPFVFNDEDSKYKRKFDKKVDHELRVLEILHYHSPHLPKYVSELKIALREEGIIPEKGNKKYQMSLKDEFKKTDFWEKGVIFLNEKIENPREGVSSLKDYNIKENEFTYNLRRKGKEIIIFDEDPNKKITETITKTFNLQSFGVNVLQKGLSEFPFYKFNNLKKYFPNLQTLNEFITNDNYLGYLSVSIVGEKNAFNNIDQEVKLDIVKNILKEVKKKIKNNKVEYKGTFEFKPVSIKKRIKNKEKDDFTVSVSVEGSGQEQGKPMSETDREDLNLDLSNKSWYAYKDNYGTEEEKYLIRFINDSMSKLEEKFKDVYLIRNENLFKIYNFSDGKAFEPDFVLFLNEEGEKILAYQLFIEPKGEHLMEKDKWKEEFLNKIKEKGKVGFKLKGKEFNLIGLPFYNESKTKKKFEEKFEEVLEI